MGKEREEEKEGGEEEEEEEKTTAGGVVWGGGVPLADVKDIAIFFFCTTSTLEML